MSDTVQIPQGAKRIILPHGIHALFVWTESGSRHVVQFCAFEVVWTKGELETPIYSVAGGWSSADSTSNPNEAAWHLRGGVKWDGCCNYEYNTNVMRHICGPRDIEAEADLMRAVYREAYEYFESPNYSRPEPQEATK